MNEKEKMVKRLEEIGYMADELGRKDMKISLGEKGTNERVLRALLDH